MKQIHIILTLSFIISSALFAAPPSIGDIEKQVQPPKELPKKQAPLVEIGGVKKYAPAMSDDKSGKSVYVKSFRLDGVTHIDEKVLLDLISSYTDKDLNFAQLQTVASLITKEYRDQGYFVARAYIPVQNIQKNNGVITIAIIEGRYGEFKLTNNSKVKTSLIQAMLDDAKIDNVICSNSLERSMLLINDTPGIMVSDVNIMSGKEVGTSDFAITTKETPWYDGYILGDNYGSRYTGKTRLMAGVNFNSPFNIGDKISLSGLVSKGTDLKNARVSYSALLAPNGIRAEVSYSQTSYSLAQEYDDLDAKGYAKKVDFTLSYPIIRSRVENLHVSFNFAYKNLEDEITTTDDITNKNTKVMTLGLDYDKSYVAYGLDTQSFIKLRLNRGNLHFDDADDQTSNKAGVNTVGSYSKINLDLSHNIAFTQKIFLESSLKMQYALGNKNLDGSEDFSIGGSDGVKLYPYGELSAENGYLLNIEAKYRLPDFSSLRSSIGIFYDRGKAFMANNNVGFESKSLQDIGIGYYVSYKDFFGQVQIAWNANSDEVTSEPNRNSRILAHAGWIF